MGRNVDGFGSQELKSDNKLLFRCQLQLLMLIKPHQISKHLIQFKIQYIPTSATNVYQSYSEAEQSVCVHNF